MDELQTQIVVALIAAVVSFLGLVISKEQKISDFRQAWINTLRDDISKFITEADRINKLLLEHGTARASEKTDAATEFFRHSPTLIGILYKIELSINPREKIFHDLLLALHAIIERFRHEGWISPYAFQEHIKQVAEIAQDLLKGEWNRVKRGEPFYEGSRIVSTIALAIIAFILVLYAVHLFFIYLFKLPLPRI